jgi:pimeloyl-ACP methyl ester carboxylesterase
VTVLEYEEAARRLQADHGHFAAVISHSFGSLAAFLALRHTITADRLVSVSGVGEATYTLKPFTAGLGLGPDLARELYRQVERRLVPGESDLWTRFSARHRTGEITLPMLLIHDAQDRVVPVSQTERVAEVYPGQADVLITRGLGHGRILSAPQTLEATLDFLAATGPADPADDVAGYAPVAEPVTRPAVSPARPAPEPVSAAQFRR